jgi:uncharacterized protein (TIGR00725 family)
MRKRVVSVCGASGKIDENIEKMAYELGFLLAKSNYNVLCGGRDGVMEAVCKGVQSCEGERGLAIGILPCSDLSTANAYMDIALPTGMGYTRNSLVALMGEVMILVGGGSGTLCEATYGWQYGKQIIALEPSEGVAKKYAGKKFDDKRGDLIISAKSAKEIIEILNGFFENNEV